MGVEDVENIGLDNNRSKQRSKHKYGNQILKTIPRLSIPTTTLICIYYQIFEKVSTFTI